MAPMETLRFGLEHSHEDGRTLLALNVPQSLIEYMGPQHHMLQLVKDKPGAGVAVEKHESGRLYTFDTKAMGRADNMSRQTGLVRTVQLINTLQLMATKPSMNKLDPDVFFHLQQTPLSNAEGVRTHTMSATISWPGPENTTSDILEMHTLPYMAEAHKNLYNPEGEYAASGRFVDAGTQLGGGLWLGVGRPLEVIKTLDYKPDTPMLALRGETSNLENMMILMIGAVSIAHFDESH